MDHCSIESLFSYDDPYTKACSSNAFPISQVKPLSFDRVNIDHQHRHRRTQHNRLFDLPVELFDKILQHMETGTLARFAQASWSCCQASRLHQFRQVTLTSSPVSAEIVRKLLAEAVERENNSGKTLKPSMGVCIRELTVATHGREIMEKFAPEVDDIDIMLDTVRCGHGLRARIEKYYCQYIDTIAMAAGHYAMRNLETLRWFDNIPMRRDTWEHIITLPIRRLELVGARVERGCSFGGNVRSGYDRKSISSP